MRFMDHANKEGNHVYSNFGEADGHPGWARSVHHLEGSRDEFYLLKSCRYVRHRRSLEDRVGEGNFLKEYPICLNIELVIVPLFVVVVELTKDGVNGLESSLPGRYGRIELVQENAEKFGSALHLLLGGVTVPVSLVFVRNHTSAYIYVFMPKPTISMGKKSRGRENNIRALM
jgi:hypothetical protein